MEGEGSETRRRRSEVAVIEEWNGTASSFLTKTATITVAGDSVRKSGRSFSHILRRVLDAFVPEGFPSSVTCDYVPFQVWDSLQGLSTYMRTMLSTQALLSAIGVGDKSATVIGATFNWFVRDLTGMLGGVLFTFYQGANLDSNAKMWRLVADLMNDLGMLMDLVSPLFPSAFLFIVCLGSISRAFTGVASGATRAALTQHFALQNNAADISAKEGSQETVATMMGMALGMLLARITMGQAVAIWFCFLSLTIFHMYANYKAVRCLSLCTLNFERSSILLSHYMETGEVLSPKQVSVMEHVLPLWMTSWRENRVEYLHQRVRLGVRISSLNSEEVVDLSSLVRSHYNKGKYVLLAGKHTISVIMHRDSTAADVLQAFMHALVLTKLDDKDRFMHLESRSWMAKNYEDFVLKLQSLGWRTERLLSPAVAWKANWFISSSDEKVD
ncbi:protein root UVB sensitive 3 [Sesamum alatum]|uniref:Protein root UVB sensitive 3 n=1 Tax=Sesamum alatum TaxID=300844 RepID=A0AAE1YIF3_9LAMI|nr:protein root UVB sensitive 3 [Sesamum alatum]